MATDTTRAYKHIPIIQTKNILEIIPACCELISVELTDDAVDMTKFKHPERALYLFGPENGSITTSLLTSSSAVVKIATETSVSLKALQLNSVLNPSA